MTTRYADRYPRAGSLAVLCEGDVAGYEVDILEKWLANHGLHADVWACGTRNSFFGMADALGRARPIVVIEDRDFRSIQDAERDCRKHRKSRQDREVQVALWRAWQRHEIENYLVSPSVLLPVFSSWFNVEEQSVASIMEEVVTSHAIDQAAQCSLFLVRQYVQDLPNTVQGLPHTARPKWNKDFSGCNTPSIAEVAEALDKSMRTTASAMKKRCDGFDVQEHVQKFERRARDWSQGVSNETWLADWAGKEILRDIRLVAAHRHGVPPTDQTTERLLEHEMQPYLVSRFLEHLEEEGSSPVKQEWTEIASELKSFAETRG